MYIQCNDIYVQVVKNTFFSKKKKVHHLNNLRIDWYRPSLDSTQARRTLFTSQIL